MRERELVDERAHLVGKRRDALGVAEPHLEQGVEPECDQPRHRLSHRRARSCASLHARASGLDQTELEQLHGEQPQQRDLRIVQEAPFRWRVQRRDRSETALGPCAGGTRPALQRVDLCLHGAHAQQRDRIVRCRRERLGPFREGKRLGILGAHAKDEPEPVQQASPHRVLRNVGESASTHAAKRALRFGGGEAKQMGERYALEALQA